MREELLFGFALLVCAYAGPVEGGKSEHDDKHCVCHFSYPQALGLASRGSSGGRFADKFDFLEKKIARIAAAAVEIQKYWETTVVPERDKYKEVTKDLLARVDKLQGTGCDESHFQCGGSDPQCISNLFVCDGSKECHNGYDEDEKICKTLLFSGTVLKGNLQGKDECTQRKPKEVKIVVGSVTRYAWFKSRVKIRASLVIDFGTDDEQKTESLPCTGHFDFATRRLTLDSPEDDRLALSCTFDKYHDDMCQASIYHQYTKEPCTTFPLYREGDSI